MEKEYLEATINEENNPGSRFRKGLLLLSFFIFTLAVMILTYR